MPIVINPRPASWPLIQMPLESAADARALFEVGKQAAVDLSSSTGQGSLLGTASGVMQSRRAWIASDLDNHFLYIGAVHPEWTQPLRSELARLDDEQLGVFALSFETWLPLLHGADDASADLLAAALEERPKIWQREWMLAAIGTPHALALVADFARRHGRAREFENMGVEVLDEGPARWRFVVERLALGKTPFAGTQTELLHQVHPIGLPLEAVAATPNAGEIGWHYLSLDVAALEGGLHEVCGSFREQLHLIGPPLPGGWTLFCNLTDSGKYLIRALQHDQEEQEDEIEEACNDDAGGQGTAQLLHYSDEMHYRNGHILSTPDVYGVVGGPPMGVYPNPRCLSCGRLMFHVLNVSCHIRSYGDGFRSVFVCEKCQLVACQATYWN